MELVHFTHYCDLHLRDVDKEIEERCNGCYHKIYGSAYFCSSGCRFWLHKSCAELAVETIIGHPLHKQQPLQAYGYDYDFDFTCQGCSYISRGLRYRCEECNFELDLSCASSSTYNDIQHHHKEHKEKGNIEHFSHFHQLTPFNYRILRKAYNNRQEDYFCCGCDMNLSGRCYGCLDCEFYLHESCVKLPREFFSPPLYSHQCLTMVFPKYHDIDDYFICDQCLHIFSGFHYHCYDCEFELCLPCFSLTYYKALSHNELNEAHRCRESKRKTIQHFSHITHPLTLFKYRKMRFEAKGYCYWCEKPLTGMSYGCLKCSHFLHESCAMVEMPNKMQHPFHPRHTLRLQYTNFNTWCYSCRRYLESNSTNYHCEECDFSLDPHCVNLLPTLKTECHEHPLTYFEGKTHKQDFCCNVCRDMCANSADKEAFYRCVQCDFNLHLKCVPIPQTAKHIYHRHYLTLMDSFLEADFEEYYCDICEEKRNPTHHVYCCKECAYVAHIECVLNEGRTSLKSLSPIVLLPADLESDPGVRNSLAFVGKVTKQKLTEEVSVLVDDICTSQQLQIQHFNHKHPLHLSEVKQKEEDTHCEGCNLKLCSPAVYVCETCDYNLHKTCAELPLEILNHPLHPQCPLSLHTMSSDTFRYFVCEECRDITYGFNYQCLKCQFIIDPKCATLTTPRIESKGSEKLKKKKKLISHFSHRHVLILCIRSDNTEHVCCVCYQPILGPTYCCLDCKFFIHESCLRLPDTMQSYQFHPFHTFIVIRNRSLGYLCYACGFDLLWISYGCTECTNIQLHPTCANSLKWALKYKCHMHNLYYFGMNSQIFMFARFRERMFKCVECGVDCNRAFYRCVDCYLNFHLECIPIPQSVKSEYHVHPLTLMNSFFEDDSGEYYCDVCEEERDPRNHLYCCKECNGLFVAHIECVLSKLCEDLPYSEQPICIIDRKGLKVVDRNFRCVKVQWSNDTKHQATWEFEDEIREKYLYLLETNRVTL